MQTQFAFISTYTVNRQLPVKIKTNFYCLSNNLISEQALDTLHHINRAKQSTEYSAMARHREIIQGLGMTLGCPILEFADLIPNFAFLRFLADWLSSK